jgi:hypothetical protein
MSKLRVLVPVVILGAIATAAVQLGAGVSYANPNKPSNCPGSTGCGCSTAYAPVVCGGCRYTNFCHAQCAGWTSKNCKDALR